MHAAECARSSAYRHNWLIGGEEISSDSVQGWSDAVGVYFGSSWAIYVCVELLEAFGVQVRGALRPQQPFRKVKSFTKKLSCCSRLVVCLQRWRHRSGWRSVVCVAPCTEGTDHGMQSQTQLVTWPTAWQQPTPTSVRSVLLPKLARSAFQPGLCQRCSTAASTWCLGFDMRSVSVRTE